MTFSVAFSGIPLSAIPMRESYNFSTEQLGFVLGCLGLGVAVSEIFWGVLTDKLGDKFVLLVGLSAMGVTFFATALLFSPSAIDPPGYYSVGAMLVIAGAVGGSINSSSGRAVMSWFQDGERGFAMSVRQTAIPVGGAIGSVIIPWVVVSHGFRTAFLTLAGICLLTTLCVWKWLIEINPLPIPAKQGRQSLTSDNTPLGRWDVWRVAASGALLTVPQMSVLTFGSVFLADHLHLSLAVSALTLVFIQFGGGALRILAGRISDKYTNRRTIMAIIAVASGLPAIALWAASDSAGFVLVPLLVLTGLAGHAWHGVAFTEIAVMSGVQHAGKAMGMMGTAVFTMSFLTPLAIPLVLNRTSWGVVWLLVGVFSLSSILFLGKVVQNPPNR